MKASEMLERAKAVISNPENWTVGTPARDEDGYPVSIYSPYAVKFCAVGACARADCYVGSFGADAIRFLWLAAGGKDPAAINDRGKHEEVLHLFDEAIRLSKENEK
jgi:hypothetical protein